MSAAGHTKAAADGLSPQHEGGVEEKGLVLGLVLLAKQQRVEEGRGKKNDRARKVGAGMRAVRGMGACLPGLAAT